MSNCENKECGAWVNDSVVLNCGAFEDKFLLNCDAYILTNTDGTGTQPKEDRIREAFEAFRGALGACITADKRDTALFVKYVDSIESLYTAQCAEVEELRNDVALIGNDYITARKQITILTEALEGANLQITKLRGELGYD